MISPRKPWEIEIGHSVFVARYNTFEMVDCFEWRLQNTQYYPCNRKSHGTTTVQAYIG
jgi:hypothetical protein